MAGILASNLLGGGTLGYTAVVVASFALGTTIADIAFWYRNRFEARLTLVLLAGSTLLGQVLVAAVGGPAGGGGHWDLRALLLVIASALVLLLIAADARPGLPSGRREHPYAL
jgi:hypothetical protein